MNNLDTLDKSYAVAVADLRAEYKSLLPLRINMLTPSLYGSGVSELASTLNDYFSELGVICKWSGIEADSEFFILSKKITEALSLSMNSVHAADLDRFKTLAAQVPIDTDCDILYMHDFHGLIAASEIKNVKKIYRCHFDISRANLEVWAFLKPYIESCDAVIFPSPESHRRLDCPVNYILPSIDPCSVKNTFVPRAGQLEVLKRFGIPSDKPLILQVSRFDRSKDPFGLIDVFNEVSKVRDSVLVYAGGFAPDDVNAAAFYKEVQTYAAGRRDIILLSINRRDYEIASLQSAADIIVQKSFSESFGIAITEALWKQKPVVASNVGGIGYQIINNKTGLLCNNNEDFTSAILRLIEDKSLSLRLASTGHKYVREHFLITRELENHVEVLKKIV